MNGHYVFPENVIVDLNDKTRRMNDVRQKHYSCICGYEIGKVCICGKEYKIIYDKGKDVKDRVCCIHHPDREECFIVLSEYFTDDKTNNGCIMGILCHEIGHIVYWHKNKFPSSSNAFAHIPAFNNGMVDPEESYADEYSARCGYVDYLITDMKARLIIFHQIYDERHAKLVLDNSNTDFRLRIEKLRELRKDSSIKGDRFISF